MSDDLDFDSSVDDAWRTFRINLADRLTRLERGDTHTVVQSTVELPDGPHGRLRFTLTGARRVRCSLVVADLHPTESCRMDQFSRLFGMGWRPLRTRERVFVVERGRRGVDELALIAERTLREIWEVVHPTFLVGAAPPPPVELAVATGVTPQNADHLRDLAAAALGRMVNRDIVVDDDGDIPLPGVIPSWVRSCAGITQLEVFACVVPATPDVDRTARFIATEAHRWPDVTLRMIKSQVYASFRLECAVFVERNLAAALIGWFEFLSVAVPDILDEVKALVPETRPEPPPTGVVTRLPDELLTLLLLIDDGPVHPFQVSKLCGHNRRTMMDFLRIGLEQSRQWHHVADTTDDIDEAAAANREADAWREVMRLLVAGIRLTLRVPPRDRGRHRKPNTP